MPVHTSLLEIKENAESRKAAPLFRDAVNSSLDSSVGLIYREVILARMSNAMTLNANSSDEIIKRSIRAYVSSDFIFFVFTFATTQTSMLQYSDSVGRVTSTLRNFHRRSSQRGILPHIFRIHAL